MSESVVVRGEDAEVRARLSGFGSSGAEVSAHVDGLAGRLSIARVGPSEYLVSVTVDAAAIAGNYVLMLDARDVSRLAHGECSVRVVEPPPARLRVVAEGLPLDVSGSASLIVDGAPRALALGDWLEVPAGRYRVELPVVREAGAVVARRFVPEIPALTADVGAGDSHELVVRFERDPISGLLGLVLSDTPSGVVRIVLVDAAPLVAGQYRPLAELEVRGCMLRNVHLVEADLWLNCVDVLRGGSGLWRFPLAQVLAGHPMPELELQLDGQVSSFARLGELWIIRPAESIAEVVLSADLSTQLGPAPFVPTFAYSLGAFSPLWSSLDGSVLFFDSARGELALVAAGGFAPNSTVQFAALRRLPGGFDAVFLRNDSLWFAKGADLREAPLAQFFLGVGDLSISRERHLDLGAVNASSWLVDGRGNVWVALADGVLQVYLSASFDSQELGADLGVWTRAYPVVRPGERLLAIFPSNQ